MGLLDLMVASAAPVAPAAPLAPVRRVFTDDVVAKLERPITSFVTLDFETFYSAEYGLKKLTTSEYVRDPRFEVILVGVKINGAPASCMGPDEFAAWVRAWDWSTTALLAHHAHFDLFILSHHYRVKPAFILDTLSMARALHGTEVGGSLAKLAVHYGAGEKGHEVLDAKGKHRKDFTPEELAAYGRYCVNDVDLTYDIFQKMVENYPVSELWLIDTTVRKFTEPILRADGPLLEGFLVDERQAKADLMVRVGADRSVLLSNDKFAALLADLGVDPPRKISAAKSKKAGEPVETWALAKSDPGFKALLEHPDERVQWLVQARLGVKSTISETRTERFIKLGEGGRPMPVYLKYHGAHTGRWSGGDKTNFQNLNRGGTLRKAIIAPPGWVVVVADSSQIEARVLPWIAGYSTRLDTFRRIDEQTARYDTSFADRVRRLVHEPSKDEEKAIDRELAAIGIEPGDFYSDTGSAYFGKKLSKKDTPAERFISKALELGLGYQLGELKLGAELLKGMLGTPPVQFTSKDVEKFNVDVDRFLTKRNGKPDNRKINRLKKIPSKLTFEEKVTHWAVAGEFLRRYRTRNPEIPNLWKTSVEFLKAMVEGEALEYGPLYVGEITHGVFGIRRPSGLTLRYPELKWTPPPPYVEPEDEEDEEEESFGGFSYWDGRKRKRVYGGSVTENIVQALARDIVGEQMLRVRAFVEPMGGKIATSTHDEIVACVPERHADEVLQFTLETMKTSPSWCPELPLWAEGGAGSCYGAIK